MTENNLKNNIVSFTHVVMKGDQSLYNYNERFHEKQTISKIQNSKICYFAWPAIVTINNTYEPKKYETKIWIVVNNQLYQKIYPHEIHDNSSNKTSSTITQQLDKYKLEQKSISDECHNFHNNKPSLPLHHFTAEDIRNKIKYWVYNDINYKKYLVTTMESFVKHGLSGMLISNMSSDHVKRIVYDDLSEFTTTETMDIMVAGFNIWKANNSKKDVEKKSAAENGCMFYVYPLQKLLKTIIRNNIDGKKFIQKCKNSKKWIHIQTGWKDTETYQIKAMLFRYSTFTNARFRHKKYLSDFFNTKIEQIIDRFINEKQCDDEDLWFKIKHAMDIQAFSDEIVNMVDELVEINEEYKRKHMDEAYYKDDFVNQIYHLVAECFILSNDNELDKDKLYLNDQNQWTCQNCRNFNFFRYIGKKMNYDLFTCSLCGIRQKDAIILKLKNYDTFAMVNNIENECKSNKAACNDIDNLIREVIQKKSFDLRCPNRNDAEECPSFIQLSKHLILYKKWIKIVSKNDKNNGIQKTIEIDVIKYIDNVTYKTIFINLVQNNERINEAQEQNIVAMLNNGEASISNIATFVKIGKKRFVQVIKKHTKIKAAVSGKLYRSINESLKRTVQKEQFGQFLSDLQMDDIFQDYHHILKTHINNGNKNTIKNTFEYFKTVVHYDDLPSEVEECASCKRRENRTKTLNSLSTNDSKNDSYHLNNSANKRIWELKQFYNQTQMDIIHTHLVHSNWKYFVQRYTDQSTTDDNFGNEHISN
eukprot:92104_1